jgi:prevent-host-death family protein
MLEVKPVSELKATMPQVLKELQEDHKPRLIVSNGQAQAVLQDIKSYQQTQDSLAMLKIVVQSEASIADKRGSETADVMDRLRRRVAEK